MIEKSPLCPERIRKITGSFAFIEHRFIRDGFWSSLSQHELPVFLSWSLIATVIHSFTRYALLQLSSMTTSSLAMP